MYDPFILKVTHKGKEWQLEAQLLQAGYTVRFKVIADEVDWIFERDEENRFRAILPNGVDERMTGAVNKAFLEDVARSIEELLA